MNFQRLIMTILPSLLVLKLNSDGFVWPCINANASLYGHFLYIDQVNS
jgi:hypothetical protein